MTTEKLTWLLIALFFMALEAVCLGTWGEWFCWQAVQLAFVLILRRLNRDVWPRWWAIWEWK